MRRIFYIFACLLVYPLALIYEGGCRWSDRKAAHAAPPPPALRHTGRHTKAYLKRERVGSQPEAVA